MLENEEWRIIEELPHYLVSNHGRIRKADGDRVRKVTISDKGFPVVVLYGADSKTRYLRQINKLVAIAFLRPAHYSDETAVWHLDGDLLNCSADNLRWDTRSRVLEWNEMHRSGKPKLDTPQVKNNRTGKVYKNAYECAMAEGLLESGVVWRIERQGRSTQDDNARYRYV